MIGKQKFFICKQCGNLIGLIKNKGIPMMCCGEKMTELVPNTVEASTEKHLPFLTDISPEKISVQVGSAPHPMEEAHHISFVYVETKRGGQRKCLQIGEAPNLEFCFTDDKPIAVYAYCNLHGLWAASV